MPNITGSVNVYVRLWYAYGAISSGGEQGHNAQSIGRNGDMTMYLDASKFNSIYTNNNKVNPLSLTFNTIIKY